MKCELKRSRVIWILCVSVTFWTLVSWTSLIKLINQMSEELGGGKKTADWWSELQCELPLRRERCIAGTTCQSCWVSSPLKAFLTHFKTRLHWDFPSPTHRYPADTLEFFNSDKTMWLCKCVRLSVHTRLASEAATLNTYPDSQVFTRSVYRFFKFIYFFLTVEM